MSPNVGLAPHRRGRAHGRDRLRPRVTVLLHEDAYAVPDARAVGLMSGAAGWISATIPSCLRQ